MRRSSYRTDSALCDTRTSDRKVRKHLNADFLFTDIRREFQKIPDHRAANCQILLEDALMSAFAMFQLDEDGNAVSIKMKGISPAIDFSYDFQDLDLKKVKK